MPFKKIEWGFSKYNLPFQNNEWGFSKLYPIQLFDFLKNSKYNMPF